MKRSIDACARSALVLIVALCGIASVARSEAKDPDSPRAIVHNAWLADLADGPPAPPELTGSIDDPGREDDADGRPSYRKAWFVMAAAGLAVLAAGLISQHDSSSGGHEGSPHLGFPPPPSWTAQSILRHERRNR
jgi:hypothetical protein